MSEFTVSELSVDTSPAADNVLLEVDVSDHSTAPAGPGGADKKVTVGGILALVPHATTDTYGTVKGTGSSAVWLDGTLNWSTPPGGDGSGVAGWMNLVGDYGADPTGAASASAAVAAACTAATAAQPAPFGLMVPPGYYKVSASQDLPYNLIMQGAGAAGGDVTDQYIGSVFQVAASFTGSYVFGYKDTAHVSGFTGTNGATVSGIYVDGGAYTGGSEVDGFYIYGPTMCVLTDIKIARMTGWAINADGVDSSMNEQFPFGQSWTNVQADSCGTVAGGGFNLNGCEDSVFLGCYSIGNNNGPGFQINGCDNSKWVSCNAEWNSNYGFYFTGDWQWFNGGSQLIGCSTDANGSAGLAIDATWTTGGGAGTGPGIIHATGCHFRRDGQSNSGNTAGIYLGATTLPVVISGFSTMPSIGDSGGSTYCPKYGVYFTQSSYSQPVIFGPGIVWGDTGAVNHGGTSGWAGGVTQVGIVLAHGPNSSPTYGS